MAWKFFNIGKANEEVTRLETEIGARDKKIKELEDGQKALADNDGAVAAQATDLQNQLNTAHAEITKLKTERDQLKKDLEAEKLSVDKKAAAKALEATAAQGQAPIAAGAGASSGGGDIEKQLQAIEDPVERAKFFKAHAKEIKSAMKHR